jgi:Tfp pilus assembly protein PilN
MDAVAKTVPNTILLNEMNFQPLIGAVKKRKEIKFEKDKIIVEGSSKYNADFTNWIATLEKKTWIKNITIVDYKKTKKGLDTFVFVITKENE